MKTEIITQKMYGLTTKWNMTKINITKTKGVRIAEKLLKQGWKIVVFIGSNSGEVVMEKQLL